MTIATMNPMQKVALFGAAAMALPVIAVAFLVVQGLSHSARMAAFSKIEDTKPPMKQADVEKLMGQPATIEDSASNDQAITAAVYHYPFGNRDMKVIFVNGTVFKTEFASPTKS